MSGQGNWFQRLPTWGKGVWVTLLVIACIVFLALAYRLVRIILHARQAKHQLSTGWNTLYCRLEISHTPKPEGDVVELFCDICHYDLGILCRPLPNPRIVLHLPITQPPQIVIRPDGVPVGVIGPVRVNGIEDKLAVIKPCCHVFHKDCLDARIYPYHTDVCPICEPHGPRV